MTTNDGTTKTATRAVAASPTEAWASWWRWLLPALFLLSSMPARAQLDLNTAELWSKDSPSVLDNAHTDDLFGQALATCDFNGDGYDDLAIGGPGDGFFADLLPEAGAVNVLYGGPDGLSGVADQQLYQNGTSQPEADDRFGSALAAGYFNLDGFCDLAVGSPGEDSGSGVEDIGAVDVFLGGSEGLSETSTHYTQPGTGVLPNHGSNPEEFDLFGAVLTVGNFNGDFYDDLAVGAPLENWNTTVNSGHVTIYHGGFSGLSPHSAWSQARNDIQDSDEAGDEFGFALTAGDFDNDGYDDLAIGVPGEEVNGTASVGAVSIILGSSTGLTPDFDLFYSEHTPGIGAAPEPGDRWGAALAAGNFDGDDWDDLAVGTPNESVGSDANAGAVGILYGSGLGPLPGSYDSWTQNSLGGGSPSEPGDQFGFSLASGDINGDGRDDLLIGAPFEDDSSVVNAGSVNVAYGSDTGITNSDSSWYRQVNFQLEPSETADYLGYAVAFGDFDGNGRDEVVAAAPNEDLPCTLNCGGDSTATDAGLVFLVGDGSLFVDGFESGDTTSWSLTTP